MGTVAYKPLTIAEQVFKDLVWTPGLLAGELTLEGAVPFFNIPVLKDLERGIIEELSDWLYSQLCLLVDVNAIRLVNAAHQTAYLSASLRLKVLAMDHGLDSKEFKYARDAARLALSEFTRFGH